MCACSKKRMPEVMVNGILRRLFYVAITRARRELYLCYPVMRLTQGYSGDVFQQQSRFLKELPPELLDPWNIRQKNPWSDTSDHQDDPF